MPYIQTNLKLTISQYHYLRELTAGMDSDSRRLFIHTFLCQRQMRAKSDYHAWKGVPLPRKSFIENFGSETPSFYDGFTVKYEHRLRNIC